MEEFVRSRLILGDEAERKLESSAVAIFGLGGVGSYAAEAVARAGIGKIALIDNDTVDISNINRQLIALHSTLNKKKTDVMKSRILDINPRAIVIDHSVFYTDTTAHIIDFSEFDYVIDAIDTVSSKLLIAELAQQTGTPVISCMGTGNKLNPERFEVADIYDTSVCPLARVMRRECKKRGIKALKVVYSREEPLVPNMNVDCEQTTHSNRVPPGSLPFVPPVAGLIAAGEAIRHIISK